MNWTKKHPSEIWLAVIVLPITAFRVTIEGMAESPLAILVVDDEENHVDVITVSLEKLVLCHS